MTPAITLFTPTYNSERFLHRVWDSVQAQTDRRFEWLVVDDGSHDGTVAWLEAVADQCIVPLRILTKPNNAGLLSSYRLAAEHARTPLLLPIGHDDAFVPEAIATFLDHWAAIPLQDRGRYAGVTARCMHPDGQPIDEALGRPWVDATPAEMYFLHRRRREKWGFTRTDLVARHLPPDIDAFVPEGALWRTIGDQHVTRYVDDVLRVYNRDQADSISNTRRIRWPRGRAYALALRLNLEWPYRASDPRHFRDAVTDYARYSLEAGLLPHQAVRHLRPPAARRLFWRRFPVAAGAALSDKIHGRLDPGRRRGDWDDPPPAESSARVS